MFDLSEGILLGLGHPLLDIICSVDKEFLDNYNLKPNDSIRANETHESLYKEITERFNCEYIAGGSVQNTLRTAQWILQNRPNAMTFMGAIGNDRFGQIMVEQMSQLGVKFVSIVDERMSTGTSACLISDNNKSRSLVAFLGASQSIRLKHLLDNYSYIEKAHIFYTSGYHLGVDPESVMALAKHVHANPGKLFCLNLSAPYVSQKLSKPLLDVFPYVDILFGNESEAEAFAELNGWNWEIKDVKEMAKLIANKESKRKEGRTVVITQGKKNVLIAITNSEVKEFVVKLVDEKLIVDTIGAGDAFVGGYFAQLVQNKPLAVCVECGIYAAQEVIQQIGCQFAKTMKFKTQSCIAKPQIS